MTDDKLYAYTLWGQRKASDDKTVTSTFDPDGIGSDGTTMYVAEDGVTPATRRAISTPEARATPPRGG